ncbi:hypothetical protein GOQ29_08180, partial [Clostridium sp. D2Q-14]|uniref:hypothetical protein n=1 Tax=Anaeromonas gelatinilytica TaxID=2683194 RepID=UPI00193C5575
MTPNKRLLVKYVGKVKDMPRFKKASNYLLIIFYNERKVKGMSNKCRSIYQLARDIAGLTQKEAAER